MAGLHRGKIECFLAAVNLQDQAQEFFKNLYDFFTSHPNYTLIALNYGSTTALPNSTKSGLGTGYYDDATAAFGYNAFFVVRANATTQRPYDVYHLFQWAGSTNQAGAGQQIGGSPGAPCSAVGVTNTGNSAVVVHAAAIGVGGTGGSSLSPNNGNPWRGGTNALTGTLGIDIKAQTGPVWGAPPSGGTGVIIFPRSNDGVGSFRTLAQNTGVIFNLAVSTNNVRQNIVDDDDSWICFYDNGDTGAYAQSYAGMYTPRPNVPSSFFPYTFCVANTNGGQGAFSVANATVYGDSAGTSSNQGGIVTPVSASVYPLQLDQFNFNFNNDANYGPDHQLPGTTFNEFPLPIGSYETSPLNVTGFLGYIDQNMIRSSYNIGTNTVKTDFSRIWIGTTTNASSHYSVPWDSQNSTVPRSGNTRGGVTFVTGK